MSKNSKTEKRSSGFRDSILKQSTKKYELLLKTYFNCCASVGSIFLSNPSFMDRIPEVFSVAKHKIFVEYSSASILVSAGNEQVFSNEFANSFKAFQATG